MTTIPREECPYPAGTRVRHPGLLVPIEGTVSEVTESYCLVGLERYQVVAVSVDTPAYQRGEILTRPWPCFQPVGDAS